MRIATLPGVLKAPSDCRLLLRTMRERGLARGAVALDMFTGTGALAIAAALDGAREMSAVDVSRRAVLNTRINARLNGVRVRALWGDMFGPVFGERFDLIVANPPYVPGETETPPTGGIERAWEGGADGRVLLDRLCEEAPEHLAPGGVVLVVHSSIAGEQPTLDRLAAMGLRSEVVARERGPLGPVIAARADFLERRGFLARGQREEELVVVEAQSSVEASARPAPIAEGEAGR